MNRGNLTRKQEEKLLSAVNQIERQIRDATAGTLDETPDEKQGRIQRMLADDGFESFFAYYFPHIYSVELATWQIELPQNLVKEPNGIFVCQWPRAHAKTTLARICIIWLVCRKHLHFGLLASSDNTKATRLLGELRAEFAANKRIRSDFNLRPSLSNWTKGDFSLSSGVTFRAYGKGQNPRGEQAQGMRPDFIWLDDIDDDEECRNVRRIENSFRWVMEALYMAGELGKTRLLCINNIIAKDTISIRLSEVQGAWCSKVQVLDKAGKPAWPSKYSLEDIQLMIDRLGYYSSQKEFFNNPVTQGRVFRNEWLRWGKTVPLNEYEQIVCYYDPSLSDSGDYKAVAVIGRVGREYHLLRMFCRQCSQLEVVRWCYDIHARLRKGASPEWYLEGIMWQHALLETFAMEGDKRGYQLPIRKDMRSKGNKEARIQAMSAWFERGDVILNHRYKTDNDMSTSVEQLLAFGEGSNAHDDAPDAIEGAMWLINRSQRAASTGNYTIVHRPSMHI